MNNLMKSCSVGIGMLLLCPLMVLGQQKEIEMAREYTKMGEWNKAKAVYQQYLKEGNDLRKIYKDYLQVLIEKGDYKEGEALIRKLGKVEPQVLGYKQDLVWILERGGKKEESNKVYQKLLGELRSNLEQTESLAETFVKRNDVPRAKEIYQTARQMVGQPTAYALQLATVYNLEGESDKMIEEYLNLALDGQKKSMDEVKNALQENITKTEDFDKLEKVLISRIQKNPAEILYNELLQWYYIQQKEFSKAFTQAKAIDRRQRLEGIQVLELGLIAMNNKDYKASGPIFDYLVNTYPQGNIYPAARRYLINTKEELIKTTYPIDKSQISSLISEYKKLIEEVGKNLRSVEAMRNMALLYGFYLDKKDSAISLLQEAIKVGITDPQFVGKAKIDLGDLYVIKEEPWESTLLYSQVEKDLKEMPVGYEAKLRNAKLSFYKGEFELAKSHLDVLKLATSREIANDAMQISLLISDNLASDSTGKALKEYASVDLLLFQNRYEEALTSLQTMVTTYQDNSLIDEIYWLRANVYLKLNENEKALADLEKIVSSYGFDIYGDDAYFTMAKVYEEKLNQKEKAMELYRNYMEKYPGTLYIPEVRKRYRQLRGDKVN